MSKSKRRHYVPDLNDAAIMRHQIQYTRPDSIIESLLIKSKKNILLSFSLLEQNKYFDIDKNNLDWASRLIAALKEISEIEVSDVHSGVYSRHGSKYRIHNHANATPPCTIPHNLTVDSMWQIRIGKSYGGIHGVLVENVFYVVWLDPNHNMYPDENHGGLKKIDGIIDDC